jgi:hypothetical protein
MGKAADATNNNLLFIIWLFRFFDVCNKQKIW